MLARCLTATRAPTPPATLQLFEAIQSSSSGSDVAEGFTVASGIAGKGKGLIATRDFHRHEEILRERAFVALQSLGNRQKVLACANCFRFVGAWRPLLPSARSCMTTLHDVSPPHRERAPQAPWSCSWHGA